MIGSMEEDTPSIDVVDIYWSGSLCAISTMTPSLANISELY